jgi:hypothetical protein
VAGLRGFCIVAERAVLALTAPPLPGLPEGAVRSGMIVRNEVASAPGPARAGGRRRRRLKSPAPSDRV